MKALNILILLMALCAISCQATADEWEQKMYTKFQNFLEKYNKKYDNIEEHLKRFEIFKHNYKLAKQMMNKTETDEAPEFNTGTTEFSDMAPEEFQKKFLTDFSLQNETLNENEIEKFWEAKNGTEINYDSVKFLANSGEEASSSLGRNLQGVPESWDWRDYGAVTSVKAQGNCGGCWSFCAVANLEGLLAIQRKQSISLSAQQLIDCDGGNGGCNGGMMGPAYNYIARAGGIQSWSSYPFLGYQSYCRFNRNAIVTRVKSWMSAGSSNEEVIKAFLYRTGPLAITINSRNLQFYKGGVFNVAYSYCPVAPDHGVTLVGYGTTNTGIKYWIIKNSWGPAWGEGGYFRIARGRGLCGMNQYVVSGILG
jgi:cathepsin F